MKNISMTIAFCTFELLEYQISFYTISFEFWDQI